MTNLNLPKKRTFVGEAAIWKRALAFILDILIIDFFILTAYDKVLLRILDGSSISQIINILQTNSKLYAGVIVLVALMFILIIAYFSLLEFLIGQTPGKMLFNLRVVTKDSLEIPKCWQCTLRSLFIIPVFPFILLWIIDPIYLIWKKERLSEWISKTKVIQVQVI